MFDAPPKEFRDRRQGVTNTMKVCVVGLGYIGFPTACVVARAGHEVLGVDVNSDIIDKLNNGGLHIVNEDGLSELAREVFSSGRLRVSICPETADVFILAVPTPCRRLAEGTVAPAAKKKVAVGSEEHGGGVDSLSSAEGAVSRVAITKEGAPKVRADLSYVEQAARGIAPYIRPGSLVILESTVSPGTTDGLVRGILEGQTGLVCGRDIYLAHAPERVLPGRILKELTENDRIIGGINRESTERAISFYRTFVDGEVIGTDATTAELVKLMENTFRDVNIALANEFALICEKLGVNVFEVIALANRHPRVKILKPGPGVGGHCIAVDPYFIVEVSPNESRLISLARQINSRMPHHVFELFESIAQECDHSGKRITKVAILGASYKANVGDERASPSLEVAHLIERAGYHVTIHDPYIERFSLNPVEEVIREADLAALLTDHDIYKIKLIPEKAIRLMRQPLILDTRGFFGREWDRAGFRVLRLGVGIRTQTYSPVR